MRSRRLSAVLAALACTATLVGVQATSAQAAPYCGITWGSLSKSASSWTSTPIVGARTGRHDCWDRLVIDLAGKPAPGYNVQYTDGLWADGSGQRYAVSGGAVLTISVGAPTYDSSGRLTVPWTGGTHIVSPNSFSAGGYRTFRDLVYAGSFEGETRFGLGVRARLPFRVFTLDGPGDGTRVIVDVAHAWSA